MTEVTSSDCDERGTSEERKRETSSGTRSGGRWLLVAYGIVLGVAGVILADEPDHTRPWRTLGVVAAVIGLICVLAPLARGTRPSGDSAAAPDRAPAPAARTERAVPVATPTEPAVSVTPDDAARLAAERAELDRLGTELAETQARIERQAAELAAERGRLDQRAAVLRAEQSELDERLATLANRRHELHADRAES